MAPNVVVIYHGPICPDGFTAAYAAWLKFGAEASYIPMNYGDTPPDVTGAAVYMVDFSLPRDALLSMHKKAARLTVLDHHHTAKQDLEGLDFCEFDMARSGAMMSWDFFHEGEPAPSLFRYVMDRDLWKFVLPHSRALNAYIMSWDFTFDRWKWLHDQLQGDVSKPIFAGEAILRYKEGLMKGHKASAIEVEFDGMHVLVANASNNFSESAGDLAINRPFGATYRDNWSTMRREWSLRSTDEGVDVSEIAKRYGGGGHIHAAGFSQPLVVPDWLLHKKS